MEDEGGRVVIVGAGPVGLSLALGLSRYGIKTLLLEGERQLCPESRAPGILPRTLEIFRQWGLLESVLAEGFFTDHVQVWHAVSEQVMFDFDLWQTLADLTAVPGVVILPQDETVRILAAALLKTGLAELRLGHRVVGVSQEGEQGKVEVRPAGEEAYRVAAPYVVGCDGAHSIVRESLGWQLEGKTYRSRLILADARVPQGEGPLHWPRVMRGADGELLAAIKIHRDVWRLIATIPPERPERQSKAASAYEAAEPALLPEAIREAIREKLQQVLGGPPPGEILWSNTFRIHCRTSPHFFRGRLLLAGDAAHINSPAGGQGMNSGIHDAQNLAWKLAACLAGVDRQRLLASYEQERRAVVMTNVDRYTDVLTRLLLQGKASQARVFTALLRYLLGFGFLRRLLAARAAMLDTRYPRSSQCLFGRHSLVGKRAVDGPLYNSAGNPLRLFDLIDPEPALLVFVDPRVELNRSQRLASLQEAAAPVPVYELERGASGVQASTVQAFSDPSARLWRHWKAESGLVALLRPDGHIGWAALRPAPKVVQQAIAQVLGVGKQGQGGRMGKAAEVAQERRPA